MRKLMTIAILLMYALSSSGTSLYLQYCCGLPHVLAINDHPETHDPCSLCTESEHHTDTDCEHDVCELGMAEYACQGVYVDTVDATTDHITYADKYGQTVSQPIEITLLWSVDMRPFVAEGHIVSFADSSPPALTTIPLFIVHCTYLI